MGFPGTAPTGVAHRYSAAPSTTRRGAVARLRSMSASPTSAGENGRSDPLHERAYRPARRRSFCRAKRREPAADLIAGLRGFWLWNGWSALSLH